MLIYAVATLLLMLFMGTRLHGVGGMLVGRVQALALMGALWLVYRLLPCRLTVFFRVAGQLALLGWWYPDTYAFNCVLPNLDHVFATWEQSVFGCQPALLFSQKCSGWLFSELMDLGYVSYYPMIVATVLFYFFCREKQFLRTSFIILAAFFIFYVIFVALPVAGPQYYYLAAGVDQIAAGHFPDVGLYFETHSEALPIPGPDGFFHGLLTDAHNAGERPTAAFPSSHVGITTLLMWLAWRTKNRILFYVMLPLAVLMFFATFYIQAHYAIDALVGLLVGTAFYFGLGALYDGMKIKK